MPKKTAPSDVDTLTPLDVMEEVYKKTQAALADTKKKAYDVAVLYNAKPKGQMRKLAKEMNDLSMEVSRLEQTEKELEYDLSHRRKAGK